jgi:hypothetical protein
MPTFLLCLNIKFLPVGIDSRYALTPAGQPAATLASESPVAIHQALPRPKNPYRVHYGYLTLWVEATRQARSGRAARLLVAGAKRRYT